MCACCHLRKLAFKVFASVDQLRGLERAVSPAKAKLTEQ
jgi:hypothetical protein